MAKKNPNQILLQNTDLEMISNSKGIIGLRESVNLPIEFSFKLALLLEQLQVPITAFMSEKQKLIEKYADRDKDNNLIRQENKYIFTQKAQWFQNDFEKLLNLETLIKTPKLEIKLSEIPHDLLSANDIYSLSKIISFKEK